MSTYVSWVKPSTKKSKKLITHTITTDSIRRLCALMNGSVNVIRMSSHKVTVKEIKENSFMREFYKTKPTDVKLNVDVDFRNEEKNHLRFAEVSMRLMTHHQDHENMKLKCFAEVQLCTHEDLFEISSEKDELLGDQGLAVCKDLILNKVGLEYPEYYEQLKSAHIPETLRELKENDKIHYDGVKSSYVL